MLNQLFRDEIDQDRFVKPVRNSTVNKNCLVCKVFYKEGQKGLSYVGLTEIPISLFVGSTPSPTVRSNRWVATPKIGFAPIAEEDVNKTAAPPRERYEDRRRDRDYER